MKKKKKNLPRHQAGQVDLKGGTGGITGTYGLDKYLEIYKIDHTFRIQTPESLDPDETVPDMPWVVSEAPGIGSGNPIVARVFIQSAEALKQKTFKRKTNEKKLLMLMHSCKENLLICEKAYNALLSEYEQILKRIKHEGIERDGKALNPFPQINDLNLHVIVFLAALKKTLQTIAHVFSEFYEKNITNPRFDKIITCLKQQEPQNTPYIEFLEYNQETITNLLDLRNYQEHPSDKKKTTILNFRLSPKGILSPSWNVTGKPESPIIEEMKAIIDFMIHFAETNFFFCLLGNLGGWIPWNLVEIPPENRNKECPIRYSLEIDMSQLHTKSSNGIEHGDSPDSMEGSEGN